ncbi:MAG TPA: AEC family transporter [Clostridia bacterium]|nr:AEC family transporter [Clostridia bacterium]
MTGIWNSISAVLLVLLMVSVGYLFGRVGWMRGEHKSILINFLIYVAVPCMCIKNVFENFTQEMFEHAGVLLLVPILFNLATFAVALGIGKLLNIPKKRFGGFAVMCAFSNSLFIGYPICYELFGDAGVPYMMFYYLVNTIAFWTLGALVIYRSGDADKRFSWKTALKQLASPPLIALLGAIALLLLGVTLPHLVMTFASYMSATVTPLALLYVGFLIYETGLKNLRPDRGIWVASAMRFVGVPALMLLLCSLFGITGLARSVFFIQAAMPVMTQSVVVSGLAGADEQYNALGMSFTTLLCLVAIPVLMLILG